MERERESAWSVYVSNLPAQRGIMRLVVMGATGQTGKELVRQALQEGHSVTAVVRSPEKVTETHDNLKVRANSEISR